MIRKYIKRNPSITNPSSMKRRIFTALLKRKILFFSLAVLTIVLSLAYLTLRHSSPAEAAWFNDSWLYRKAIAIPSHTSAENNVYVTAPTFDATDTTKFQSDCGDLRFTKQNGELLPYYVVSCSATANVHVQFDTLPAGASTYYMYYGNPSAQNGFESADFATAASGLGTQTLAAEEQSPGPIAYWKFDEGTGTTTNDSTSNRNAGTLTNMSATPATNSGWITEDACIAGKCLGFDGGNDYVSTNYSKSSGDGTVSLWFKMGTQTNNVSSTIRPLISQGDWAGSGGIGITTFTNNNANVGKLKVMWGIDSGADQVITSAYNNNSWHYVAITKVSTTVTIYVDGLRVGTQAGTDSVNTSTNFQIGGTTTISERKFAGFLDEVKIYPYARSAAQIKADYNAGKARAAAAEGVAVGLGANKQNLPDSLSNGLVGYWKMDEATWSGTLNEVLDSSGNGNNGQAQGATGGKAYPTGGKFGNGGYFDGVDDYVSVADSPSLRSPTSAVTITAWFNTNTLTNPNGHRMIFGTSGAYISLYPSGNAYPFLSLHIGGTQRTLSSLFTPSINTWYQVVGIYDGSMERIYVNGILKNSAGPYTGTLWLSTATRYIGRYTSAGYEFSGQIDDFRIYNRALSAKEVRDLYDWAPGPKAYLKLEEGTGTTANDSSGNSNTGTLNNGALWKTGKVGKGVWLEGSDDTVSINDFSY